MISMPLKHRNMKRLFKGVDGTEYVLRAFESNSSSKYYRTHSLENCRPLVEVIEIYPAGQPDNVLLRSRVITYEDYSI